MKENIRRLVRYLANKRGIGRFVRTAVWVWRGPDAAAHRASSLAGDFEQAIKGLRGATERHEDSLFEIKESNNVLFARLNDEFSGFRTEMDKRIEHSYSIIEAYGSALKGISSRFEIEEQLIEDLQLKLLNLENALVSLEELKNVEDLNENYKKVSEEIIKNYELYENNQEKNRQSIRVLEGQIKEIGDLQAFESGRQKDIMNSLDWIKIDNDNIRNRIEFTRKEMLYEIQTYTKNFGAGDRAGIKNRKVEVKSPEKLKQSDLKLNLGCGHLIKEGYINVDSRDLPGVDLVASVHAMPFEENSISEIYSAHMVEHFSENELQNTLLPYWYSIMKPLGKIILIAPNMAFMLDSYASNQCTFNDLKNILFGGQEYEGDFHLNMLSPEYLIEQLKYVGFKNIAVLENAKKNGDCFEFHISGEK